MLSPLFESAYYFTPKFSTNLSDALSSFSYSQRSGVLLALSARLLSASPRVHLGKSWVLRMQSWCILVHTYLPLVGQSGASQARASLALRPPRLNSALVNFF